MEQETASQVQEVQSPRQDKPGGGGHAETHSNQKLKTKIKI